MNAILISTFVGLALGLTASADEPMTVTLTIANHSTVFYDSEGITISRGCRKGGAYDCQAYSALKQVSRSMLMPSLMQGGKNPGGVLCELVKGKVIRAHDLIKNEVSLCKFSDQSLVTLGSLSDRARENDEARKPAPPASE